MQNSLTTSGNEATILEEAFASELPELLEELYHRYNIDSDVFVMD